VISDLQTKLRLFIAVHPTKNVSFLKKTLRDITRNNICCELLDVYLETPEIIGQIKPNLFELRKDLILNLPMILLDLKDHILQSDQEHLSTLSGNLKSSLFELQRVRQQYRTDYLTTRFFPILKKRVDLPLVPVPDENSVAEMFATEGTERLLGQLEEMEHKGLPADFVSDYWKERVQRTVDHTKDLGVPLPRGKYGLENLTYAVQQRLFGQRFSQPGELKQQKDSLHVPPLPYLKTR